MWLLRDDRSGEEKMHSSGVDKREGQTVSPTGRRGKQLGRTLKREKRKENLACNEHKEKMWNKKKREGESYIVARDYRLMGNMQSPTQPPLLPSSLCESAFDPASPLKPPSSPPPPPQIMALYLLMHSFPFPYLHLHVSSYSMCPQQCVCVSLPHLSPSFYLLHSLLKLYPTSCSGSLSLLTLLCFCPFSSPPLTSFLITTLHFIFFLIPSELMKQMGRGLTWVLLCVCLPAQ